MRAALRELHEETGIQSARIVASVRACCNWWLTALRWQGLCTAWSHRCRRLPYCCHELLQCQALLAAR